MSSKEFVNKLNISLVQLVHGIGVDGALANVGLKVSVDEIN